MSDTEFYSMFITCGPVESCRIARDRGTGYSYGYGFVQYSSPEGASKAVKTLTGVTLGKKKIKAGRRGAYLKNGFLGSLL